ncbi:hypothetical protein E3U26_12320 [Paracoccus ferrooxidans]|nr:hypothetical protein E3U26_12320 [Paracoccus ferrooxidans]
MTHHDKARELVTKLRGICVSAIRANYAVLGASPLITANEAIHEAADIITAQAEENRRLRDALRGMVGLYESDGGTRSLPEVVAARSALSSTGEKG